MAPPEKTLLKTIINDHFVYEVTDLYNCKALWTLIREDQSKQAFVNMNIEHTLLHARGLYEFYYCLDGNPDNYDEGHNPRANMYIRDYTKPGYTAEVTKEFMEKSSDQIQHMGIHRTSDPAKKFNVGQTIQIATDLLKTTNSFLERLEKEEPDFFEKPLRELKSDMDWMIEYDPRQLGFSSTSVFTSGTSSITITAALVNMPRGLEFDAQESQTERRKT
jgi:hypothetical protein